MKHKVHVGNKYKPETIIGVVFFCGRGSPVGNPYPITADDDRDNVCDRFEVYFDENKNTKHEMRKYLVEMLKALVESDITLLCYCYPKRCHCDTIKKTLEETYDRVFET